MPNAVVTKLIEAVARLQADMVWVKKFIYVIAGTAAATLGTVLLK